MNKVKIFFLKVLKNLDNNRFINLSDERKIKIQFKLKMGKDLDLNNPKTFNEKLQWLKLNDRKEIYSKMVDKYDAKEYVSKIIGNDYIIPTIGIYNSFDDIDFNTLPDQFVIKCTHDSGCIIICKDKNKLDIPKIKKKIKHYLKRKFFYVFREWPYKNVKPRIIIEEYMEDKETKELRDYKFFCFNGEPKFFKIDFNRTIEHHANYYDINGKLMKFGEVVCPPVYNKILNLPKNLALMIELAKKLSKDSDFLRVDFYEVDGKVYFGELTFYPAAGLGKFIPENWDNKIGDMLNLSKK